MHVLCSEYGGETGRGGKAKGSTLPGRLGDVFFTQASVNDSETQYSARGLSFFSALNVSRIGVFANKVWGKKRSV